MAEGRRTHTPVVLLAVAYGLCVAVYILRLDHAAGLFVDDAWYVILAKALAEGHGFTVTNSPSQGIAPLYPPGFPAVLSLVFRVAPSFPENVLPLKSVSVVSIFLAARLAYTHFTREKGLSNGAAHGLTVLTLLTPALVFLATSTVMSECFFTFLQLGAIVCVERCVKAEDGRRAIILLAAGALFASLAFLTRPIGVGLLVAAGVYFLFKRRVGLAALFTLAVIVVVGPWLAYSRGRAQTPGQKYEQQGLITQNYVESFWQKAAGDPGSGTAGADELPARVAENASELFLRDAGGLSVPALYRPGDESGQESLGMRDDMGIATDSQVISCVLGALCVLGFVVTVRRGLALSELSLVFTLAIILVWPWLPFRFLLPFTPFILLYLLRGVEAMRTLLLRLARRGEGEGLVREHLSRPARVFLLLLVLLNLYDHANYLLGRHGIIGNRPEWLQSAEESGELMRWMRENLPPGAVIATENPPLVNLYTGHKTIWSPADPITKREDLARRRADYLVHVSPYHDSAIRSTDAPNYKILQSTNRKFLYVLDLDGK